MKVYKKELKITDIWDPLKYESSGFYEVVSTDDYYALVLVLKPYWVSAVYSRSYPEDEEMIKNLINEVKQLKSEKED